MRGTIGQLGGGVRIAVTLAAMIGMAGCAESATGPDDGGADGRYTVTVTAKSIVSASLCEEAFTDFDGGEFVWKIAVRWPDGSETVVNETSGYPSAGGFQKMQQNQARPINQSSSKTIDSRQGSEIGVVLRASEVDFNLFGGNPSADGRMNDQQDRGVHKFDAAGWPQGSFTVTVRPDPSCQLLLAYDLTAVRS